ncbi:MAG: helix-turn-helix domain-containing protein [Candidatus Kerfeldbacteria bacterium]|nr:helix-turn-helix domain-containing protein [Candidatus Kerfeldbacteria bacterium]
MTTLTDFSQRSLTGSETVGERLQRRRNDTGASLQQIAEAIHIRVEYLLALEQGNYTALPGSVFIKNYVKKYAKFLQLNPRSISQVLDQELTVYNQAQSIPALRRHLTKRPLQVTQIIMMVGVVFFIVLVSTYFVFEVTNIIQPPILEIVPLPNQVAADQRFITIAGQTVPEATVAINDQAVPVKADGSFSIDVVLQPGANVFKMMAKTKRSKSNVQYHTIVSSSNL